MLTRVIDRSADGSMFQLQCECCGTPLDWVTGLELTVMAVQGLPNWCFDCAGEVADIVPEQMLIGGQMPDVYIIESNSPLSVSGLSSISIIQQRVEGRDE